MRTIFGLILLTLILQLKVRAQSKAEFQIWTDINPYFKLSDKWFVIGDLGYRFALISNSHSAYVRPEIGFRANSTFSFISGIANFNSWNVNIFSRFEVRTFQFALIHWPKIGGFTFNHRVGLEQRFLYFPELDANEYVNRSRYYLELKSPNFNLFNLKSPFFVIANFELLRDLNQDELGRLVDHNRYTIGAGNQITEKLRVDVRFKLINVVDPLVDQLIPEINLLRIRVYYRFAST